MTAGSALYVGEVMHRRLRPKPHHLRHAVFWMLLDLDKLDALDRRLTLFSRNCLNFVSFFDRDHAGQTAEPLRVQVEHHLASAGIDLHGGAIRLFCMPRVFGYGFNPLSIYFCHQKDGALAALLYEVRNTFGERHSYLIPVARPDDPVLRHSCDKAFYVSPFMDMDMRYEFRVAPPGDRVSVAITGSDARGDLIVAALAGNRAPLTDASLVRLLVGIPFLTLKVVGAIHWHALKMWARGFTLKTRPPCPDVPVTIVETERHRA